MVFLLTKKKKKQYQNESIPKMSEIVPKEWYVWDISTGVSGLQLLSYLNLKKKKNR